MDTYEEIAATLTPAQLERLGDRLEKALAIANNRTMVYPGHEPNTYSVRSQTHHDGWYMVNTAAKTCTCKDSTSGHACKHRLAVWLQLTYRQKLEEEIRAGVNRSLASTPTGQRIFATYKPLALRVEVIDYQLNGLPQGDPNIQVTVKSADPLTPKPFKAPPGQPYDWLTVPTATTTCKRSDLANLFISA